jgi:hypothetical protein
MNGRWLPFMAFDESNETAEGSRSDGTAEDPEGARQSLDGSSGKKNTVNLILRRSGCLLGFSDILIVS